MTCHWAGADVAASAWLAASNALQVFIEEPEAQEWLLEQNDTQRTVVFVRGRHEEMSVRLGPTKLDDGVRGELPASSKRISCLRSSYSPLFSAKQG